MTELDFTQEEWRILINWWLYINWEVIETEKSLLKNKEENLWNMTLQELLDSDENFSDLWILWKDLWKLLSDKFFGWNIYKELQLHRIILQKLLKVVIKWETLSDEDLEIITSLETMDNQAETILEKFRKVED